MELWILIVVFIIGLFFTYRIGGNKKCLRSGGTISDILRECKACPQDFESFCAGLFIKAGYKASVTAKTNDGGYDLCLSKNGVTYIGECKLYTNTTIGRPLLQKLVGANATRKADRCLFITTSTFSKPAKEYAKEQNIWLIDKYELQRLIDKYLN